MLLFLLLNYFLCTFALKPSLKWSSDIIRQKHITNVDQDHDRIDKALTLRNPSRSNQYMGISFLYRSPHSDMGHYDL